MKLLVVSPGTGARWVREGLLAFRGAPMAFFSLFMLFMAAMALLASLPLVGVLLAVAVGPASTLAIMVASETVTQQRLKPTAPLVGQPVPPMSARVFMASLGAVREKWRSLAIMGVIYAVAVMAVSALATLLVGDPMADAIDADGTFKRDVVISGSFQGAMALRMLVYVPVALVFWHAPALLHWHGVPPVKALFFSFVTCVRNIGAMFVFMAVWIGVALAVSIVLAMLASLLMTVAGALGAGLMVGGSFLLSAMFFASAWFSFRDCFQAD